MAKITVQNTDISVVKYYEEDYISLTDMARSQLQEHIIFRWLSLKSTIEYLGECRDVRPYIAQSHVIVLPSWREGTPTAIMEAMSMGRPCVVSDAPGCREVVREGYNGFLVPVRDAEALAGAMGNFLRDPAIIAVMGEKGRQLAVADFDADKVAAKIINDMGLEAVK